MDQRRDEVDKNIRKKRYRLSPELVDGDHWSPVDTIADVLRAIEEWAAGGDG